GMRTVEIARIVGSVGRAEDLDENFRSLNKARAEEARFQRILDLMTGGRSLPPVVLYKLGYGYYVLDGNHRVAAAKRLGQLEIDALVTQFVPLGDAQAQRVFADPRACQRTPGLPRVGAAVPAHSPRLEEMIRAFAQERELADLHEAARRWEAEVYRPVARKIRELRLTQRFPGERTADVFVHLANLRDEAAKDGHQVDWDDAIARIGESRAE